MQAVLSCGRKALRRAVRAVPFAALAVGASLSTPASAYDGVVTSTISGLDSVANETNNYEVRVYLTGIGTYCTGPAQSLQFAYMNSVDNNFKATLSMLELAFATGKTVTVFMSNDNNVGCHIHYIQVR